MVADAFEQHQESRTDWTRKLCRIFSLDRSIIVDNGDNRIDK